MLSKKDEQMSFSNRPLRDQWEKKAQLMEDECKQEAEWKKKSSLKISNSKWNYHWTLVFNGDFKRLTSGADEEEKNKPKIKFKIVPPPPKPKHEPAPPPPPPRKTAFPKRLREKRKVEVDVFGLCWRDSWMSLKPPKYLYLRDKETKSRAPVFTTIEVTNNRKYKPKGYRSESEWVLSADEWNHSWKQVRSPAQLERSEEKPFQWEILFKRKLVCKAEIELYSLPVWAGTWKIMTFAFRQRKKNWDCIWPVYQLSLSKFDRMQLKEQEEPSDWEDSWKLSGVEQKDTTDDERPTASSSSTETTSEMKIIKVFLPGWNNSWLLSAAPLEEEQHHKDWSSCWGYRQQIRWCKASLESHFQHSAMLTRRRKAANLLLTSHLDDVVTDGTEWTEAWRTPKRWVKPQDDELDKEIQEEDKVLVKKEESEKENEEDEESEVDNKVEESEQEDEEEEGEEEDDEDKDEERDVEVHNEKEDKEMNKEENEEDEVEEEDNESHDEDTDVEEKGKMCKVYEDEEGEEEEDDKENEAENDQEKDVNEDWEEEEVDVATEEDASGAEEMVKNNIKDEEEDEKGDKVMKQIKPDVPFHLQFHKLNTSFPSWKKSWIVAVAYRGGDKGQGEEEDEDEDDEWWAWKESWRICKRNKPDKDEVVCFSTEHRSQRFMGLMDGEDQMPKIDWNLSWKMTKTAKKEKVELF